MKPMGSQDLRQHHRASRFVSLLVILTLPTASAAEVIKLATLGPLSGYYDYLKGVRGGAELAVLELKTDFLLLDMDLQLVSADDQGDPATGIKAAQALADDPQVLAVVGAVNSGVTVAVTEVLKDKNLSFITPTSTRNVVTDRGYPNVNRMITRDDGYRQANAIFLSRELAAKTLYIIDDGSNFLKTAADEMAGYATASGLNPV